MEFKAKIHSKYLMGNDEKFEFREVKIFTSSSADDALKQANLYCEELSKSKSFAYKIFDIERI